MKIETIKNIFSNDLNLAKYYLITEAIEDATLNAIKALSTNLLQQIENASSVKNKKLQTLKNSAIIAKNYIDQSFNIKNSKDVNLFKKIAGNTIAAIEFYFLMENFIFTLANQKTLIETAYKQYTDSDDEIEPKDKIEDPELQNILEINDSIGFKKIILNSLNKQSLTKNVQVNNFKKATNQFIAKPILIPIANAKIVSDLLKLSYKEYINLISILVPFIPLIKNIREAIGSSMPQDIRKKILNDLS